MTPPSDLPLLPALDDPDAVVAWRGGVPLSAGQLLTDAYALAQQLPAGAPVLNLCADRFDFAVAFAAALQAGCPSLLPPNAMAATLAPLLASHPSLVAVGEWPADAAPLGALRHVALPPAEAACGPRPVLPMPLIPGPQSAAVLLTSGSTGAPVAHARTWQSVQLNASTQATCLAALLHRPSLAGYTLVSTVPAQHSYGFESTVMLAWASGAAFDAGRPFYPADIALSLSRVPRPRALVTTPFHLKTLLEAGLALPPVDLLLCATAPLSPQLAAEAEARLGGPLIEIYGCTEAGQIATRRTTATDTWTTYDGLTVHSERDADTEHFVVQGGHVPAPTPLADVLELDDAEHFRLLGRSADLIKVAGKRSSLAHLNFHLNAIPGVVDGAFWMPDETAGQTDPASSDGIVRPLAFVVAPTLSAADIKQALRARLDAVFVPRRIVLVTQLPREATGKLTAATLRALAARAQEP